MFIAKWQTKRQILHAASTDQFLVKTCISKYTLDCGTFAWANRIWNICIPCHRCKKRMGIHVFVQCFLRYQLNIQNISSCNISEYKLFLNISIDKLNVRVSLFFIWTKHFSINKKPAVVSAVHCSLPTKFLFNSLSVQQNNQLKIHLQSVCP